MFADPVFARSSTFLGSDRDGLERGITYIETEVMDVLSEVHGFVGLSMMVDRGLGECIATTAWETVDAMRASSDRITAVRGRFGGMLQAPAKVQEWEVAVMHRAGTTAAERWCRVIWLRTDHSDVDYCIDVYRGSLLPRVKELPGFCSASLMVDRVHNTACATAAFQSLESLQVSREEAWAIRDAGIRDTDVDIMDAAEYELAVGHLRVPETV